MQLHQTEMKTTRILLTFCFSILISLPVLANRLDPYLDLNISSSSIVAKSQQDQSRQEIVSVIIQTKSVIKVVSAIQSLGGVVHSTVQDVITVNIPKRAIPDLLKLREITYIEASKPLKLFLNKSAPAIHAPEVNNAQETSMRYTGKNVIIGIVDTGIDWRHPAFQNKLQHSRILALWDQSLTQSGSFFPPSEIQNAYGLECLRSDIGLGNCPSIDEMGHGTHVAGIAGGSKRDSYQGIAPEAEFIVVKLASFSSAKEQPAGGVESFAVPSQQLIDAVHYIFKKADSYGKPVVVNLSLGANFGAHDGTSLVEQALSHMVKEKPGRSIVAAAGNLGSPTDKFISNIHAGAQLKEATRAFEFMTFSTDAHELILELWQNGDSALSFGIGVDRHDQYETTKLAVAGETVKFQSSDGQLHISLDASEDRNPLNQKKHVVIRIGATGENSGSPLSVGFYNFDLIVSGTGSFDAWLVGGGGLFSKSEGRFHRTGYAYLPGDGRRTLSIPSTSADIICVASYASRDELSSLSSTLPTGYPFTKVGDISPFSSVGPSSDISMTGPKPEIAAPGEWIISAASHFAVNQFRKNKQPIDWSKSFVAMVGTSMAAPHVTGAVALILERNPALTQSQIQQLLRKNTSTEGLSGPLPDLRWGYGKLDIAKVMQNFNTTDLGTSATTVNVSEAISLAEGELVPPAPSLSESENGNCSLNRKASHSFKGAVVLLFLWTLLLVSLWVERNKKYPGVCRSASLIWVMISLISCGSPEKKGQEQNATDSDPTEVVSPAIVATLAPPSSKDFTKEGFSVDTSNKVVWYYSGSVKDNTTMLALVPMDHFFGGMETAVGSDNYYFHNGDQSLVVLYQWRDNKVDSTFLAVSGHLKFENASTLSGRMIKGNFQDLVLRELHPDSYLIRRGGEKRTLSKSFESPMITGVEDCPILTHLSTAFVKKGDSIVARAFNIRGKTLSISLNQCRDLSYHFLSEDEISINIDKDCGDGTLKLTTTTQFFACPTSTEEEILYLDAPSQGTSPKPFVPVVKMPLPLPGLLHKVGMDSAQRLIYILVKEARELLRYSIGEKIFLPSLPLMASATTFAVNSNGTLLAIGQGLTLNFMDPQGDITGSLTLPSGQKIEDIVFVGEKNGFFLLKETGWGDSVLGRFDLERNQISFPQDLKLTGDFHHDMVFAYQKNRSVIAAYGTTGCPMDVELYHKQTDGSYIKGAVTRLSCGNLFFHPVADALWVQDSVYNYDLSLNRDYDVPFFNAVGISPAGDFIVVVGSVGKFSLYDISTGRSINSDMLYKEESNFNSPFKSVFVTENRDIIIFDREGYLYQADLREVFP